MKDKKEKTNDIIGERPTLSYTEPVATTMVPLLKTGPNLFLTSEGLIVTLSEAHISRKQKGVWQGTHVLHPKTILVQLVIMMGKLRIIQLIEI